MEFGLKPIQSIIKSLEFILKLEIMSKLKEQFKLGEAFGYFFRVFQKPDPSKPTNFNIKTMHVINKISITMFLICLCVMVYRAFFR